MKLSIVSGASSGIGAATAYQMASDGYAVVLVARNKSRLEDVAARIGENVYIEVCDTSDGDAVLSMADRILKTHGVPDVIVNAAGAGEWKFIEDTIPSEAVLMMNAPYFSAFNMTHAFMQGMLDKRKGLIIHVNSPVSVFTWPACTGYAAARWALRGLHEALCDDLVGTGVKSCQVIFGKVSSQYFEHNKNSIEKVPGITKTVRTITPDECAKVISAAVKRPRRNIVYPFMFKVYYWSHAVFPWFSRWLLRTTGVRHKTS